jgi:hypothetical protein
MEIQDTINAMVYNDPERHCIITGKLGCDAAHLLPRRSPYKRYNPTDRRNIHFLNRDLHNHYDRELASVDKKMEFWFNYNRMDIYLWMQYLTNQNLNEPVINWYFANGETVGKSKRQRTNKQNARYWSILNILSLHTGHLRTELHDIMKIDLWGYEVVEFNGKKYKIPPHSKFRDTQEFNLLSERVETYAESLGCKI